MLSSLVLRQGLAAAWDEVEMHSLLQGAREGLALPAGLGQGGLWLRGLAALLWLPGFTPGWLHAPVLAGLLLEGALLWALVRRLGGSPAQAGAALAVHLFSRLTWIRATTTLGFALAPLWALTAWCLALWSRGRFQALVAGLVSGLLLGEYEGLLPAGAALAWIDWRRERGGEREGRWHLGGLLLGWGLLALLLPDGYFSHYAQVRGHSLAVQGLPWWRELAQNLGAFFLGAGKPLQDAGLGAALNLAALLLAVNGLRRLPAEGWLFLLAGLALLAAPAPAQAEAHRAALAWAPLCVAAGLGLPADRKAWIVAFSALAALALWDARRFAAQRDALEPQRYEYSWRLARAARRLQGQSVASELNFRSLAAFRLRHRGPSSFESADWALLSSEQTGPRPDAALGAWHPIQQTPETGTLWLLKLKPEARADWALHQRFTASLLLELRDKGWVEQLDYLRRHLAVPGLSAFQRSLILDRILWAAKDVGMPVDLARACAQEPWLSARQSLALAVGLEHEDPKLALALVDRALVLDPQRPGARRFRAELMERQR